MFDSAEWNAAKRKCIAFTTLQSINITEIREGCVGALPDSVYGVCDTVSDIKKWHEKLFKFYTKSACIKGITNHKLVQEFSYNHI